MENPPFSSIIICYSPLLISPAETVHIATVHTLYPQENMD